MTREDLDMVHVPIVVNNYAANDVYKLRVTYTWFDFPENDRDYTVSVYTKETMDVVDDESATN